jgi:type IV secretion system protein VirB4
VPEAAWLSDAETLSYLHSCVSTKRHKVRVPETPMHLDALLADQPLAGGLEPRLGSAHLRTLSVVGFPSSTFPGILDELNRLAFPVPLGHARVCMDKTDAAKLLGRIRRQWFAKRKNIAAILKEVLTNEASSLIDTDAANKAADADEALQELGADMVGHAYVTATVTVWHEDPRVAADRLRLIEKVIQGRDFTTITEGVNAVEAWLGSLPGHLYANVRQPPISTINLAHMIPLSAVWAGPERNEHSGRAAAVLRGHGRLHALPLSHHVGDVGHTLVVGPTGAGKSVLLALMALPVPALPRRPGVRVRFRRLNPRRRARDGRRLARSRRRSVGERDRTGRPCSPCPRSTSLRNGLGPPSGWPVCSRVKGCRSRPRSRTTSGPRSPPSRPRRTPSAR